MADNIAVTQGAGTTVAADDISSVFYQRVKLSLGADGTAVDAVASAGTVSTATQRVVQGGASTATQTSVDSVTTAGGVTILASNAARLGATITNTDANALYLYFGAAGSASSSVYNVQLLTGETLYIDPGGYSGVIAGIWAADGSGAAKVCEFTT